MNHNQYHEYSEEHQVKTNAWSKIVIAFLSGGILSILGQLLFDVLVIYFSKENATILVTLSFILMASLLTGFGIYDKLAKIAGAGLFVPITGFSNSLTSSAIECKNEGLIYGIGSNMFKLAGSVITYGIVSAITLSMITYLVRML